MYSKAMATRLGVLVAGSAAIFSLGMTAPAMAAKPADGTVGHVPDKVPGGQTANGADDANNGWRCDGNNGVGKGNPAHPYNCPTTSIVTPPESNSTPPVDSTSTPPVDSTTVDFN